MKIRSGFVSNSSSSSFIIVGTDFHIDNKESLINILKILGHSDEVIDKTCKDVELDGDGYFNDDSYILSDLFHKNPSKLNVDFSHESGYGYIGKSLESLNAIINFSEEDKDQLSKLLGTKVQLHFGEIEN